MKLSLLLSEEREEGIEIGEERGMNKTLFTLVKSGDLSVNAAARTAKISEEEFKTKMQIYYQQNND